MMYNKNLVRIDRMKSGKLGIETPFNAAFKDELKAVVPSAKWQSPYWVIAPSGLEQAKELLSKYYPADEALKLVRIEWDLNREAPEIDGVGLANVNRDYWSWRNNCPIDFKVIKADLETGGSRKNPGLYGNLVIEAKIRPGADISPEAAVNVLEDGEAPNLLAEFSTEDMLAELARRHEAIV